MGHDPGGRVVAEASARSGIDRWRLRVAGVLLVVGGLAALVALALPWTYWYWPASHGPNPSFVPETHAPIDTLGNALSGPSPWPGVVWMAFLVGLPLAFVALGACLLARREVFRLRWRLLVLFASVIAFAQVFLLAFAMGFATIDSGAAQRVEVGEVVALWAPLAPFLAGLLMPSRRRR